MKPHVRVLSLPALALLAVSAAQAQAQQSTPLPPLPTQTKPPQPKPPVPGESAPAQSVPAKPAPAQPVAQSAEEVFEFHDLIGTFAINCNQPVGPRNPNAVYVAQGDGTVEFALMVGPTRRRFTYIIDWAEEIAPGEISFSMFNNSDDTRINVVYLLDGGSIRAMESVREDDGEQLIKNGLSASNVETQWFHKCE